MITEKKKRRVNLSPKEKKSLICSAVIIGVIIVSVLLTIIINAIITAFEKNDCPHPYGDIVSEYSEEFSVPTNLIYAVIRVESNFDPKARSSKGATGLMQIMPVAYQDYCTATREQYNESKLYDPRTNIRVGTYWLARWYDYYGNWDTALAAYNAGPGNVNSWLEDARYSDGDGILFDMPFEQTEKYVQKVNRYKTIYDRLYT